MSGPGITGRVVVSEQAPEDGGGATTITEDGKRSSGRMKSDVQRFVASPASRVASAGPGSGIKTPAKVRLAMV